MNLRAGFASVACVFALGCGGGPAEGPLSGQAGIHNWTNALAGRDPKPGLDAGAAYFIGSAFLVWSDASSVQGKSETNPQGTVCQGRLGYEAPAETIDFRCETVDGRSGKVVIGGTTYALADGGLFLVARRAGKVDVLQLQRDLSRVKLHDRTALQEFGRAEGALVRFFDPDAKQ